MATKKSRKLKKADKALAAASKVLSRAEKKRDSILASEKAKLDKKLDRVARAEKAKTKAKASAKKAKSAKPEVSETEPATPVAVAPVAAAPIETAVAAGASTAAFTVANTVAELREAAKANNIAGYSKLTKAQLLDALN